MSDSLVLVSNQGPVRTFTLNRPQALNSFTAALHRELLAGLDAAAADASVRCVVITGAGRGFCAGQDLNDEGMGQDGTPADVEGVVERHYKPLALRIRAMPVPVIAMVNGVAAGAGASIALACDVVVAARSASFVQAFSRIGLVPDAGASWLLPRLVGRARALGMALFGDKLPADEAERIGLVWRCVDDAELIATAHALATRLAQMPTRALVATRQAFDHAQQLDLTAALAEEARLQGDFGRSADFREGVGAFAEKRPPRFGER